jgi:hypothetical protein
MEYIIKQSASAIEPMIKCIRGKHRLSDENKTRRVYMQFFEDREIEE